MAADTSFSLLTGNSIETRRVRAGGVIFREGRAIYLTARALGLTLVPIEARGLDALEQALATMVSERAGARRAGR